MSPIVPHKRGANFGYAGFKLLGAGNWSAKCTARDAEDIVVQEFTVTLTPPVGPETRHAITIRATHAQTKIWPLVLLKADVAFYDDSTPPTVIPTDTFVIRVEQEQSRVA